MTEIQSLARGLQILDLLNQSPDGISVTELAERLAVDKGSASRLLATLAHYAYVEKEPLTRRFQLGPQVVKLSRSLLTRMPLRETARPFLQQLMERTGECAHLAIHTRGQVLYIDQVESPATLRVNADVGTLNPLHCTALGKALLAFGNLDLPGQLESFTPNTKTDPAQLNRNLAQVRQRGYAIDDEEFDPGVRCIAVPVFDFDHKVSAAIGISGPASRVTHQKLTGLAAIVVEIGKSLSERISFTL